MRPTSATMPESRVTEPRADARVRRVRRGQRTGGLMVGGRFRSRDDEELPTREDRVVAFCPECAARELGWVSLLDAVATCASCSLRRHLSVTNGPRGAYSNGSSPNAP